MPEDKTEQELDNLTADLQAGMDSIGLEDTEGQTPDPDNEKVNADDGDREDASPDTDDDPYVGLEEAKLIEELKARDEELEKAKKSHKEIQSLSDKRYNDYREELATLKGKMDGIMSTARNATTDPYEAERLDKAQAEFDSNWAEKIAEDPGKNTIEFFRGSLKEVRQEMLDAIQSIRGEVKGEVRGMDPAYRANKDNIDALAEKYGVSTEVATQIYADHNSGKTSQPGKASPPGRTSEGRKANSRRTPSMMSLPQGAGAIMRMAGLDEDAQKRIQRKYTDDMAE